MTRQSWVAVRNVVMVCLLSLALAPAAMAQSVGGAIAGQAKDTTGAVLPGVTVEIASPALIEGVRSVVTDDQGSYRVLELRPGVYTVTFTLPGFQTFRREGLNLGSGFTATVDGEMRVGALEETVTVQGSSPVVDIENTRQQTTFTRELLDSLPTNRSVGGFATLTLGAVLNSPTQQNVGGNQSEAASAGGFSIHGNRSDDQKLLQDGMPATDASFAGNTNKNAINQVAVQEMVYQTGGITAEAETGGVQINVVPREGGNTFSFYSRFEGATPALQSSNLSDRVRSLGVNEPGKIKKVYDVGGALGGPLRRDKLWFFTASRVWGSQNTAPGNYFNATQDQYIGRPDSGVTRYTPDLDRPAYTNGYLRDLINVRVTYKATEKSKFNFSQNYQKHCDCFRGVDTNLRPEAVALRLYGPTGVNQVTWTHPASNQLLFEAGNTVTLYFSETGRAPGVERTDISILEQSTGYRHGAAYSTTTNYADRWKKSHQVNQRFVTSYITGAHTMKVGFTNMQGWQYDRTQSNHLITPYGEAPVAYRFNNGIPNQITQLTELEGPVRLKANIGLFIQDQWQVGRLTLNGGLRYNHYNAFVPATKLEAKMFQVAIDAPAVENVPNWNNVDPRFGGAYDVFGNGKTAVKASLGRYVAYEFLTGLPRFNGPTRRIAVSATRTWADANGDYYPDCILTNPNANGECGNISNRNLGQTIPTTTYADDVLLSNRNYNWQGSVSVQQELMSGVALNIGYFRTSYGNLQVTTNQALTPADFDTFCVTAPTDSRLGDASGQQICGLYDVKPAKFGQESLLVTQSENFGGLTEVYNGVDIGMQARYGQGGVLQGGINFGQTNYNSCNVVQNNPQVVFEVQGYAAGLSTTRNDTEFCDVTNSNQLQAKFAANYPLPWWGIEAAAVYQNNPGYAIASTAVFSNAAVAPSLGRNLSAGANANVTVPLMRPFSEFSNRIQQLDLRFTKRINIGRARMRAQFDIYNANNSGTVLAENVAYGAQWRRPTSLIGARLMKFGGTFEF